jgi:hypothetical protein
VVLGAGSAWASPMVGRSSVWRMAGPSLPIPESRQFQTALLRLALRKAGASEAIDVLPSQSWMRQVRELQADRLDVAPLPAVEPDPYTAFALLRVDTPLRWGLLGARQLLVMAPRLSEFEGLVDAEQLSQRFTLGYGSDWGDLAVMQRLGVRLRTAPTLALLYDMLRRGEIDYLSRGLNEVEQERHFHAHFAQPVRAVPGVLLSYPLDDCFYVNPKRPDLHQALDRGLRAAQRDGSHAALMKQHYAETLAPLGGSRVLSLKGYPTPGNLPAELFDGWRGLLPERPKPLPAQAPGLTPLVVRMAAGQAPGDPRFRYATELLSLALRRAGFEAQMVPIGGLTQARQALELARDQLDVGQLPAVGAVREGQALPVSLPIRRGLLGVRLLLAHRDLAEAVAAAPDLATLQRRFRFGHGADWGDLGLMRSNGFRVTTAEYYPSLFRMLEAGRFDCLSRSVSEVWDELAEPSLAGSGGLVVVPRLALFYPLDDFFWVNPARPELAEHIHAGLLRARADGSFDRLYRQHYGTALARAQLKLRTVFRLPKAPPLPGSPPDWLDALERFALRTSDASSPLQGQSAG